MGRRVSKKQRSGDSQEFRTLLKQAPEMRHRVFGHRGRVGDCPDCLKVNYRDYVGLYLSQDHRDPVTGEMVAVPELCVNVAAFYAEALGAPYAPGFEPGAR